MWGTPNGGAAILPVLHAHVGVLLVLRRTTGVLGHGSDDRICRVRIGADKRPISAFVVIYVPAQAGARAVAVLLHTIRGGTTGCIGERNVDGSSSIVREFQVAAIVVCTADVHVFQSSPRAPLLLKLSGQLSWRFRQLWIERDGSSERPHGQKKYSPRQSVQASCWSHALFS